MDPDVLGFKWELSPGLEHHCGVCHVALSNPRSISSCIGVHVEPCRKFHQQFHFLQKSHDCKSCARADEMHHGRHRSIGKLVKYLEAYDKQVAQQGSKTRKPKNSHLVTLDNKNADLNRTLFATMLERMQPLSDTRHLMYKDDMNGLASDDFADPEDVPGNAVDNLQVVEEGNATPTITTTDYSFAHVSRVSTPKPSSSVSSFGQESSSSSPMRKKDLKKAHKAARLIRENKQNIISNDFLEFISEALHSYKITDKGSAAFEGDDETDTINQFQNEDLKENLGFQQYIRNNVHFKQQHERKDNAKRVGNKAISHSLVAPGCSKPNYVDIDQHVRIDNNFFARLGLQFEIPNGDDKKRREIVTKLAKEILDDITITERDDSEAKIREAGFWRFVNRTSANNLREAHHNFSWTTGEIRKRKSSSVSTDGSALVQLEYPIDEERCEETSVLKEDKIGLCNDDSSAWVPSVAKPAFESMYAEIESFIEYYNHFSEGEEFQAAYCKFAKDAGIFTGFQTTFDNLCNEVMENCECKTTIPMELLVDVDHETRLRYKTLNVPLVCTLEGKELEDAIQCERDKRAAKETPIVLKFVAFSALKDELSQSPTSHRGSCSPKGNRDRQQRSRQNNSFQLTKRSASRAAQNSGQHDVWEAVRPLMPSIRTQNPYEILNTIEEDNGNEDASYGENNKTKISTPWSYRLR